MKMKGLFCSLLLLALPVLADQMPDDFTGSVKYADAEKVRQWYAQDYEFVILDVRTMEEYADDGHIEGSVLYPYSLRDNQRSKNEEMLRDVAGNYDRETVLLVMCSHGMRATQAAWELQEKKGFSNVYVFPGGFEGHHMDGYGSGDGWKAAGLPMVD